MIGFKYVPVAKEERRTNVVIDPRRSPLGTEINRTR
jgi:hypothetical protein